MSDPTDFNAWIARAEEDYKLATSSLRYRPPLTYGACFHAQQCAEKYLKAILVSKDQPISRTHDLSALDDSCARHGILLGIEPDHLDTLSSYAVRVRYPGDDPTPEEARRAVKIARSVRGLSREFLNLG